MEVININEPLIEIFNNVYINGELTHYLISDYGRCYNTKTNKFLDGTINTSGRRIFGLKYKGVTYRKTVARWIALAFIELPYGDDPEIFHADHIDEDITNDTLLNIQWLTPEENMSKHYTLRISEHSGENNSFSILTEDIVHMLFKDALMYNMTPKELSIKYSINRFTIQKILSGINWRHIYDQYDMSDYESHIGVKQKFSKDIQEQILTLHINGVKIKNINKILIKRYGKSSPSLSYISKIINKSKS